MPESFIKDCLHRHTEFMYSRDYRRQESQTRREHKLLTTTTTRTEVRRKKTQTQHAWLIRDNVGVPIVANIPINQWQTAALAPVYVQKPFGLILYVFFAFCSCEAKKIAWMLAGKSQWEISRFDWINWFEENSLSFEGKRIGIIPKIVVHFER